MNEYELAEKAVLDQHEPTWVAQGYEVVRQPTRANLPDFLASYVPDALLLGRTPKVVVEVVRKGLPNADRKIENLRALVRGHADWRLEVLYSGEPVPTLPTMELGTLKSSLQGVRNQATTEPQSALLMAWAILEAIARRLEPTNTSRPQSPGRIVELLAGAGYISPSEAATIRQAVQLRNNLIHGNLEISPTKDHMHKIVSVIEDLVGVLERRMTSTSTQH